MPQPRTPRLRHVSVTLRVSVDPVEWKHAHDGSDTVEESVRKRVVDLLRHSREFVNVRRAGR